MTPLQPLMQASMKPPSPLHAPEQGSLETDITSAPEKRTKNALFSPAKAMTVSVEARPAPAKATTVSVEARPAPAKATAVSDNRAAWSAEPDHSARGRRLGQSTAPVGSNDTTATHISHVIYLGHFSRHPKNVAIPTMQIRYLNKPQGNYVRN